MLNEYEKLRVLWKKLAKALLGANGTGGIKINKVYFKLFCMITTGIMQRIIEQYTNKHSNQNNVITEEEFEKINIIDHKLIAEIVHECINKKVIWEYI